MNNELFTDAQREEIFNRCKYSAYIHNLTDTDLHSIINMFEFHNIEPPKIGNIIKLICVLIEERNKNE